MLSNYKDLLEEKSDPVSESLNFESKEYDIRNMKLLQDDKTIDFRDTFIIQEDSFKKSPPKAKNTSTFSYHKVLHAESLVTDSMISKSRIVTTNNNISMERKKLTPSLPSNIHLSTSQNVQLAIIATDG